MFNISQVALTAKTPPVIAGDTRETGVIPGQEGSLEDGIPTYSSILAWRIPMNRRAWQATVQCHKESDPAEAIQHTHSMWICYSYDVSTHQSLSIWVVLAIINNAARSICIHTFGLTYVLISLGYETKSTISGSYNSISDL